jgi:hypothetical protein
MALRRLREDRTRPWRLRGVARTRLLSPRLFRSPGRRAAKCRRGDLGMTGAGVGIQGSELRTQKRASRAGIQLTKPIGPLESTDIKKDGTIADLKPRLAPTPSHPRRQHAKRQHEQGSHRVHIASRFTTGLSKCKNGTKRAAPSRIDHCGSRLGVSVVPLFFVGTNPTDVRRI